MKKSILAIVLITALLLSLAACSKSSPDDGGANGSDITQDGLFEDLNSSLTEPGEGAPDAIPPEDYGKFIENPFISTEQERISTFSADVDTASYTYFRRLVNAGYSLSELIATAGNTIRTEEMINYFHYGYQSPSEGELFSTEMQIAPCPWNENASLLMLGLQAKKLEATQRNNLVFLIDVSGSMASADKLELLKRSFSYLIAQLGADDVVSIVTYSGEERVVLKGCSGAKGELILNAVDSLEANGATNGEAGLQKAYQIAEEYFIADGNNRIIMASDGDLNVGISSKKELKQFVSQKRDSGVFLSVLGFGTGNYKDAQMEAIADCGNGVYYYIDSEIEAEKVFGTEILSTLYTVAKDVKLQMTFEPAAISAYRLVGYENRLLNTEDFEDDTKDAGELGAGHSLTVCYELILTDAAKETDTWMTLDVRYKAPDGTKSEENSYTFGKTNHTEAPDERFRFVCAVIETAMILHESDYIGAVTLSDIQATLGELTLNDDYQAQFRTLIETLITNGK